MSKPIRNLMAFMSVFLTLIALTSSTLSVYNLQALHSSDLSLLNITYSIANYGFVPLGKTIVGKLVHSPDFSEECTPQLETDVDYDNKFMLIPRGKCEFVTKTLNAQKLGAQLAIIMDDQEHQNLVIMKDNGYGYKANIPSIFINYKDGQKLKALLQENDGEQEAQVILKIQFLNQKTEKVKVDFYLQSNNRHSYRFVQNFAKLYPKIKDNIDLQLVYYNIRCPECLATDCYQGKFYCAINYIHEQSATGRDILDQQIREHLVWRSYPSLWWKYMKYIGDQCSSISQLQSCNQAALKHVGIDATSFKGVFKTSFTQGQYNQRLVYDQQHLAVAGINRFPAVALNNQKLKGSLHADFVFDDICNTLKDPPSECNKYVETQEIIENNGKNWLILIFVVLLGLISFSVIFCLYRRHMKKKISKQMQGRVDDMVSKYSEFYSQRNKA